MHYDVMSAFQKSIRGSDVNAALHYLARLIAAGDLPTIVRRLLVISYEDIGLASPGAGQRTLAAIQAAERLGFPEARIPLSQAVIELCLSPKSNSAITAYPHNYDNGYVAQQYLPDKLKNREYYTPKATSKTEQQFKAVYDNLKQQK